MKDDAAKILLYILVISITVGLLVLGGYYLVTGEAYTTESSLESNVSAGFYPYIPPTAASHRSSSEDRGDEE